MLIFYYSYKQFFFRTDNAENQSALKKKNNRPTFHEEILLVPLWMFGHVSCYYIPRRTHCSSPPRDTKHTRINKILYIYCF